jgi:hypothetical protein
MTAEDPHAAYTAAGVDYQALDAGKRGALTEALGRNRRRDQRICG